jgi:hypothetical protein
MRRKLFGVAAILATGLLMLVAWQQTATAQAASRIDASGTFTSGDTTNEVDRTFGPVTIITEDSTTTLTGTLSGTVAEHDFIIIRPNGTFTQFVLSTFTGSVDGRTGTAPLLVFVNGDESQFTGRFVLLPGTGGLAGVHGSGTIEGSGATGTGTYSGNISLP